MLRILRTPLKFVVEADEYGMDILTTPSKIVFDFFLIYYYKYFKKEYTPSSFSPSEVT